MKMLTQLATALAVTLATTALSTAWAEATLNVGDNVVVTAINGQTIKKSIFKDAQRVFRLEGGKHLITAKYERLYDLRHDEHDIVRSGEITVPAMLQDNKTYLLAMPDQPQKYPQAKQYAEKPTLTLSYNGQVLASQQGVKDPNQGIFGSIGGALGGILGLSDTNQTIKAQAIQVQGQQGYTQPNLNSTTVNTPNQSVLDQFLQVWLQANPAERNKIRTWVSEN